MTQWKQRGLFDLVERPRGKVPAPEGDTSLGSASVGPSPERPEAALTARLGIEPGALTLTDNRVRFLSARPERNGLRVRLHRVFLDAPEPVLAAVARLCDPGVRGAQRAEALATARAYFAKHAPRRSTADPRLRSQGAVHDLATLRDRLEREYFDGDLKVAITWGRGGRGNANLRRGAIHLRLGSYEAARRLVRIHPVLDRAEVPEYVVEAIVYHEMLHAAEPPAKQGRRRRVHTAAFRRRERLFHHHDEAERWVARNLRRLARWRNEAGPEASRGRRRR